MDDLRDDIQAVLVNEGADSEGGWHNWRCFDKGRYPDPCTCTDEVVDEVMVIVDAAVAAAEQRVLGQERTKEKWFLNEEDKQALIAHGFAAGVQAAREAVADLTEMLNRQKITHAELIGPSVPVLIEVSRVEACVEQIIDALEKP